MGIKLTFNADYGHDLETAAVYADKNKLHQVFRNLLSNAIKFTPRGGHVTIDASLINKSDNRKTRTSLLASSFVEEKCSDIVTLDGSVMSEKWKKDDWWIRISVRDTGCGIDKVRRQHSIHSGDNHRCGPFHCRMICRDSSRSSSRYLRRCCRMAVALA